MISRIYFSKSKALFLAVEDILKQFYDDYFVNDFDFVIFAIHPSYPYDDISFTIKSLLKSDNFIAFNAVSAFANQQIVEGVSALFIKFEKKGNIEIYSQDNLEKENKRRQEITINTVEDCLFQVQSNPNQKNEKAVILKRDSLIYLKEKVEKRLGIKGFDEIIIIDIEKLPKELVKRYEGEVESLPPEFFYLLDKLRMELPDESRVRYKSSDWKFFRRRT